MSFLSRIDECRVFDTAAYVPFHVGDARVGLVRRDLLAELKDFDDVLSVGPEGVRLADGLEGHADRTAAFDEVLRALRERGRVPGWRDEPYAVKARFSEPALLDMERAAVPLFGVEGYGVHVNGFVRDGDGGMRMWIGRRSRSKPTAPGKLDQIVAGGLPAGVEVFDNLIKEAAEEAAIPEDLARRARPVGTISYCTEQEQGLRRDVLFNYDLELPADFEPRNTDGEIEEFYLWPMERVMETVRETMAFKFNCAVVVVDFLIRRGFIGPDHPEYVDLCRGLQR